LSHISDSVAQDEQDRSLLQSLELDHKASLIDLEQAGRRYSEAINQPSSVKETVDQSLTTDPADATSQSDSLVNSAREEVESIRLSLPGALTFDNGLIQSQIARHSQRFSKMLEGDHQRLSQRWSLTISSETTHTQALETTTGLSSASDLANIATPTGVPRRCPSIDGGPHMTSKNQDPHRIAIPINPREVVHYKPFVSSLHQLELSGRRAVMQALVQDVLEGHDIRTEQDISLRRKAYPPLSPMRLGTTGTSASTQTDDGSQQLVNLVEEQVLAWHKPRVSTAPIPGSPLSVHGLSIDLRQQRMTSLPEEVVDMMGHHVVKLCLRYNLLTKLPLRLGICKHLRHLDLSNNNFATVPEAAFSLLQLETLNLRKNSLRNIPYKVVTMPRLKSLSVEENSISVLPPILGSMPNLLMLYASGNPVEYPSKDQIDHNLPTSNDSNEDVHIWTNQLKHFLQRQDILVWTQKLRHPLQPSFLDDSKEPGT
jgi:hypothetical protein